MVDMVNVWAEWQTCEANGTAMREVDPAKDPFVDIESQPGLLAEGLVIPQEWKGTSAENVLQFFFLFVYAVSPPSCVLFTIWVWL